MKKILSLIISYILIFSLFAALGHIDAYADDSEVELPSVPSINSKFVVLMDADSGEILYSINPDSTCYPASTTKILTGLLVVENCVFTDTVTFSDAAVHSISYGDANVGIVSGEQLTVEQALYCLILRSANEVAYGLAEHTAGTVDTFANMMNAKVAELGAVNTHFSNPSGLTASDHYTTPRDLALIARACFDNKTLMKILSYPGLYTIGATNKTNKARYYRPRYKMLSEGDYAYRYSCGGKTGFTDAAQHCLVSFASKDDLRLICVVMHSTEADCYKDTTRLFDYVFNNYEKKTVSQKALSASNNNDVLSLIKGIDSSDELSLSMDSSSYILLPNVLSQDMLIEKVEYNGSENYHGKDTGFACIDYYYNDTIIGTVTIYADYSNSVGYLPGYNGVPLHDYPSIVKKQESTYIDLRFVIVGAVIIVILIIFIIVIIQYNRSQKNSIKKLHF